MKKSRIELESKLLKVFDYCAVNKKMLNGFQESMKAHNYSIGSTNSIIMQMNHISTITDEELLWFTFCSLDVCSEYGVSYLVSGLKVDDYFTKNEIQNWSNSKISNELVEDIYPVEFENTIQVASDQFFTVLTAKEIYSLYRKQLVNYNKNTQRQMNRKLVSGNYVYTINANKKKINEIKEEMKKGLFISNTLALNVSLDNPDNDFDYVDNTFILKLGKTDIIDGYHRFKAITDLVAENENFDYKFPVMISTFTEDKAKKFIVQEDKQTPMKKNYTKSLEVDRFTKIIIEKLNSDLDSALYGKLTQYNDNGVDYNAIVNTINEVFDSIETRAESISIANDLKLYFNDFIDSGRELDFKYIILIILCCKLNIKTSGIDSVVIDEKRLKSKIISKSLIKYCTNQLLEEKS